jgi:hypothetical protein
LILSMELKGFGKWTNSNQENKTTIVPNNSC